MLKTLKLTELKPRGDEVIRCLKTYYFIYSLTHGISSAPYADSGKSHGSGNGQL
jgi:hypothetical protein